MNSRSKCMPIRIFRVILLALTAGSLVAVAQTIPVPPEYQDLYATLGTQISNFDAAVQAGWDGTAAPVSYAPQLEAGSSALYTGLLAPNYYNSVVLPQLGELQALGATSIKVQVSFPILYQPFYGPNVALYQSMASFYQQLARDIHARGLKLIVESTAENQFPGDNAADFTTYYQTLTWDAYMSGRAQNSLSTAQLMQPDFITLVSEPDSEAAYTGQTNAGTVAGSTQLLQTILTALSGGGITGVQVGAGAGTWLASLPSFIQSFVATSVDYVDIHVFLVNQNYMMNALSVADTAHAAGKAIALSSLWDYKIRDSEIGTLTLTQVSGRDPFSFWEPIDTAFLQALSDFSNYEQALFISPFYSQYFLAYLDYTTYGSMPGGPLLITAESASLNAALTGAFTPSGLDWLNLSIPQPDTIAPATPAPPTATNVFATSAMLNWTATTDNVGVSAYNVYRNHALITTTSLLQFSDEGLTPGTAYAYTLTAVDASGNVSQPSAPLGIQTTTAVPPTIPGSFRAQAVSSTQINLSWNASFSGAGIYTYQIFRGSSAANLTAYVQTPGTSYNDAPLVPLLTYYYAVLAIDTHGNQSSLTPPIAVTTPVEAPPSTPGLPMAQALAYNRVGVTWPASVSSLSIGGYLIYRGTSPTSLAQVSYTFIPVFTDVFAAPATMYYYAVVAYDVDGVLSGQSPAVSVTTPQEPAPTAPSQVNAQAISFNQVSVSWSPSASVAGVGGYVVYRGTSPSTLSPFAATQTLAYTDIMAQPSTTYYYAVVAHDVYGLTSPQSSVVSLVTPTEPAPTVPTQLAGQVLAYNSISLSWTASSSPVGLWGYLVYRGTSPSSMIEIGTSKTTSYSDAPPVPNTTYYYAVVADDVHGVQSAASPNIQVSTPQEPPPTAPSNLVVQALGYKNVTLSWLASSSPVGLWGYLVYRGTSPSSIIEIGTSKTTSYSDAPPAPNTTYYYAVVTNDVRGLASAQSPVVSVVTPSEPPPSVPSGLSAQAVSSSQTTLSWSASTSPAAIGGYVVYRGISSTNLNKIGSSKTTAYTDNTVHTGTTYYYAVAAYDIYGVYSPQSLAVSVTTP